MIKISKVDLYSSLLRKIYTETDVDKLMLYDELRNDDYEETSSSYILNEESKVC